MRSAAARGFGGTRPRIVLMFTFEMQRRLRLSFDACARSARIDASSSYRSSSARSAFDRGWCDHVSFASVQTEAVERIDSVERSLRFGASIGVGLAALAWGLWVRLIDEYGWGCLVAVPLRSTWLGRGCRSIRLGLWHRRWIKRPGRAKKDGRSVEMVALVSRLRRHRTLRARIQRLFVRFEDC